MDSGKSRRGRISRQRGMQSASGADNARNTQNAQKFLRSLDRTDKKYNVYVKTTKIAQMNRPKYLVLCVRMNTDIHQSKAAQHALRTTMQPIRLPKILSANMRCRYRSRLRKIEFVITVRDRSQILIDALLLNFG